jgi:tRNA threonylcarbamoyladenosine biosynthesis protein TsaE
MDTINIGRIIGECLIAGDIVALIGDMGTGKTCLTQGIARGLRVPDSYAITSPTFTLINEYPGKYILYHFDIYRLQGSIDLDNIGYEEYFFGKGVSIVEWAEKIMDIIPDNAIKIFFTFIEENMRRIEISAPDKRMDEISAALSKGGF